VTDGVCPGCSVRLVVEFWLAERAGGRRPWSDEAIAAAALEFSRPLERDCSAPSLAAHDRGGTEEALGDDTYTP
jgi:hypothetical protein